MVQLKIISNVTDSVDFAVDDEQSVKETRVLLQEILGYDASVLTLTFRGSKLSDNQTWDVLKPKEGEKLFASVDSRALKNMRQGNANAGGGATFAPGFGTASKVSKEQEERDAVKRAEGMEPMINMIASNPGMIDMMIQQSPELKQMIKEHPEVERELRNPEVIKQMLRAQFNPDARREMNTSMQMQMAQLNTIPGGMAMLENKLGGLLNEQGFRGPRSAADLKEASEANSTPQAGQTSNDQPLPNPWASPPAVSNNNTNNNNNNMMNQQMQMMQQMMGGGGMGGGMGGGGMPPGMGANGAMDPALLQAMMGGGGMAGGMGGGGMGGGGMPPGMGFNPFMPPQQPQPQPVQQHPPPPPAAAQPPRDYSKELTVLVDEMGFENEALCLEALEECNGDIDDAVCYMASKMDAE